MTVKPRFKHKPVFFQENVWLLRKHIHVVVFPEDGDQDKVILLYFILFIFILFYLIIFFYVLIYLF